MRLFWGCYDLFWFSLSCAVNWVKIGLPKTVPTVSFGITLTHFHAKVKWIKMTYSPLKKRQGNWTELTFVKTSGTVTKDREKIGQ